MSAAEVLARHQRGSRPISIVNSNEYFACSCRNSPFTVEQHAAHQLDALKDAGYEVIEASPGSSQEAEPKHPCRGFQWVGQSFASCDGCGLPYWEHTHDTRMRDGAGPFDEEPFDYVPITDAQKVACKAKWGGDR